MGTTYDVIIVGARCSGSPLAMLLARRGHRVLVLDRTSFPSDTISTHNIWPAGGAALHRWELWPKIEAARPALCRTSVAVLPFGVLRGPWHKVDDVDYTVNLRRFKLDAILVDGAREAGAEVHERARVERLVRSCDTICGVVYRDLRTRRVVEASATVVVGADGRDSTVARQVGAEQYRAVPSLTASYYAYYTKVQCDRDVVEVFREPPREYLVVPTDEGLTLLNLVISRALLPAFRRDAEGHFTAEFARHPILKTRLSRAKRVSRVFGATKLPNFYRRSHGPGWALVGDAGYHKDPVRAQGIHDAFLDAEALAEALDSVLSGRRVFADALAERERTRDERTATPYQICIRAARLDQEDSRDEYEMFRLVQGRPRMIAEMRGLVAGSMRPEAFFDPRHMRQLLQSPPDEPAGCS